MMKTVEIASPAGAQSALSSTLVDRPETSEALKHLQVGPAFCQPALTRFQEDLRTVLGLSAKLPRRDLINTLTGLISLHLALYYYHVSLILGLEIDRAIAAGAGV